MAVTGLIGKNSISVILSQDAKWQRADAGDLVCWAKGQAFLGENFLENRNLAELFSKERFDFDSLATLAGKINGNFAIIIQRENEIYTCADKIRSYPIFYGQRGDSFAVGDDAHAIKDRLGADKLNSDAIEEFLMSGYVSGNETLYQGLYQIRAGEAICFKSGELANKRYYAYYNPNKSELSMEKLADILDDTLTKVFLRLIRCVEGRKIVVPLSGGVDSRLVVSMLKKSGYKDAACFSYGVPKNWESDLSRKIAERAEYEWIYVPYSRRRWHEAYRTKEWQDFFYSHDNLSSLPNINDWIAVRELKRKKLIPDDSVFVPGHTGDFISGGHLQYIFGRENKAVAEDDLLCGIIEKHCGLWPARLERDEIRENLSKRLSNYFKSLPLSSEEEIAGAYEYWEWQERQAKFIVNSVRTYDFWNYEWRVPLWDSQMMDFWSAVPYELKLKKRLYLSYLRKSDEFGLFGDEFERKRLHERSLIGRGLKKFVEYFRDTNGVYGIYDYFTVSFLNMGRRNINSILVKDYLKGLQRDIS